MNRRERRQAERDNRRRQSITVPMDGRLIRADVLTPQGVEEVTNYRKIPAKRPGVHRWICVVSHYMSDEQADAFTHRSESSPVLLDSTNLMAADVGCVDCEQPYREVQDKPCPAGDEWRQA